VAGSGVGVTPGACHSCHLGGGLVIAVQWQDGGLVIAVQWQAGRVLR